MDTPFLTASKETANNFLQNIVFIDDKAFDLADQNRNHDFDAYRVTRAFAEKKKICAIYKPKTLVDIEQLAELAKRADITVLDWQINLADEAVPVGSEEEDAENIDPRGPHTLKIIREILSDPFTGQGSLKLIIIYTGEIGLQDICDDIHKALLQQGIAGLTTDFCEISTDNIKILVIAKPDNEVNQNGGAVSKFIHNPKFNARVKSYDQLPDFILDEFTKMTSGLLSNFVLKSLTVLRNSTFRLIKLYNKELDQAFLTHRLLLPNPEDSEEQLIDIFSDSVRALLHYNQAGTSISIMDVKNWIDTQSFNKVIKINGADITINGAFVKVWAENSFEVAVVAQLQQDLNEAIAGAIKKEKKKLVEAPSLLTDEAVYNPKDIEFSILMHHKSIFKPSTVLPKLTLGAVVKGNKSGYWVCIQQRCDSVRMSGIRRFLFLPLKDVTEEVKNNKFNFVSSDHRRLQLSRDSFDLRTIKFASEDGEDSIIASENEGSFVFKPLYKDGHVDYHPDKDEIYEWVLDLKDLHAQRIAHDFANVLSRIGLDESEWLRLKAK